MKTSDSVRALLKLCGKKQADLVRVVDMKSIQSLNNKFLNNRWSAADLVKVAEFAGAKLAFILPDGERVLISGDPVQAVPVGDSAGAGSAG